MRLIPISRHAAVFVRSVLLIAVTLSVFSVTYANAQNSAAISGAVQDTQKAQIPGARVIATRAETGDVHEAKTDDSGFFSFPVLLPGHYDLKVEKDGFSPQVQSGVQIFTGRTTPVTFILDLGKVEEHIDVQGDVALLQTATSAVSFQDVATCRSLHLLTSG